MMSALARPRPWSRWSSVRGRLTAAAVGIIGVVLLAGSLAMLAFVERSLTDSVRADLRTRADEVVAAIEGGAEPASLTAIDTEEILVQVLDPARRLVAASEEAEVGALGPVGDGRSAIVTVGDEPYLAYGSEVELADGDGLVLVARSVRHVAQTTGSIALLLAVGIPLLLVVLGATAWVLVGRALAPVESMRREVEAISARELHRRVPRPPGDDEIARLAATMNHMLERLEAAQRRQRQLVADTSHELRSPIASIRQHVEVALAHPQRTHLRDLAETVLAEDLRLATLVDDLLLLAELDEGTVTMASEPVDLDDLVLDEAHRLRNSSSLRIDTRRVSAARVRGDESRLRRALSNLGDNATRHARAAIAFSLDEAGGSVYLRVDDDGLGIHEQDRERVFERFVRLDDARARDSGGSGLGLAIVAEVVAAHNGSVTVCSSPLGGARFEVVLPRTIEELAGATFSEGSGSRR